MSLATVPDADPHLTRMRSLFEAQREAFRREPYPPLEVRRERLQKLLGALQERRHDLASAISEDFGHRSRHESLLVEVLLSANAIRYALKNLKSWMKPQARSTSITLQPAGSKVLAQPLGVVGVVSPWNYPVQLAITPLAYALAAGDRVLLKPSELTPRTAERLAELLGAAFPEDLVAVVQGGPELGQSFAELPFDHLLFTGSTHVGRLVMQAAAKNLTPVTLELGGKSPAIVHPDYPLDKAGRALAAGKLLNAGQTCVAPDYVLVRKDRADALVDSIVRSVSALYPRLAENPDYTSIVNARHRGRLQGYLADAQAKGAELVEINPADESFADAGNKMAPVVVRRTTEDMVLMQEEIFGPVLPIVEVESMDQARDYVARHPRPLALYYFDDDASRIDEILRSTHSGGVTVNDCMLHVAEDHLPFGGVGPSGMGAYHGREGFDTFSHRKAVLHQSRLNTRWLSQPPYDSKVERLIDLLL
jgi:coniferyl-aldehyde dehydrogenase